MQDSNAIASAINEDTDGHNNLPQFARICHNISVAMLIVISIVVIVAMFSIVVTISVMREA